MKKAKIITRLLTATLIAASFAGCGSSTSATTDTTAAVQDQTQTQAQSKSGNMAKVVSMEGDTITVLLADTALGNGDGGTPPTAPTGAAATTTGGAAPAVGATPPSGSTPPDGNGQGGGGTPPAAPSGTSGAAVAGDPTNGGPGSGGRQIQFATEKTTYTLSDSVTVTKGMGTSAAKIDLSEIAADTVINFTTETDTDGNEVITAITVME